MQDLTTYCVPPIVPFTGSLGSIHETDSQSVFIFLYSQPTVRHISGLLVISFGKTHVSSEVVFPLDKNEREGGHQTREVVRSLIAPHRFERHGCRGC
jgi:hypothetical protein